ncbi:hypothetical protein HPB47_027258 [Ixodes persulcatus]|uniref:Uncharacterized protein n=1 Tax=Ixodes persulcatus TaxID=34615 RepID=A0AC60PWI4_IXOPE|nr:hypothetical protein HPB47_027258 [Ixodes persulcatus]
MALPRITARQMQRSNAPSATAEEHYRRNVYLPLLAYFENQLRERFDAHGKVVAGLNMLLPRYCASASLSAIDDAVKFYLGEIPLADIINAELTLWMSKCCQIEEKDRPACALQALGMCNQNFFPNIHSLLCILATLPVSTSTPERTFSTLRRLKSYLRNHMKQDKLTGLALLSVHREIQVDPEEVLTDFCRGRALPGKDAKSYRCKTQSLSYLTFLPLTNLVMKEPERHQVVRQVVAEVAERSKKRPSPVDLKF